MMLREDPANPGKRIPEDQIIPCGIDPDGRYHADNLRPGLYLIALRRELIEVGEVVNTGPSGVFSGTFKGSSSRNMRLETTNGIINAKHEEITPLGEVEVRPRETAAFDVSLPEELDDTKAGG